MLIDSHAHMQDESFDADREEVLERACGADVRIIMTAGTDVASSERAVKLAEATDGIYALVGVQPNRLGDAPPDWPERIRELAAHHKVKGIGETGMDLYRKFTPPDVQREAFVKHLRIARELGLPAVMHSRGAGKEVLDVIESEAGGGPVRGIMHCFTGKEPIMRRAVQAGLHISFAGPLTYPISRKNRELLKKVPDSRLLIETDSPFLGAQPVKHRRNEPSYLRFIAGKVAEMRRVSPRDVARITTLNADDLFDLGVGDRSPKVAYGIRSRLYLNITNRCTNSCTFCPRSWETKGAYYVKGHNLRLEGEPSVEEVEDAVGDVSPYREAVFCGFGEPTIRLDVLLEVAKRIRAQGQRVRLDTNGLGSLHHGRNIVPELVEVLDSISVSVNTADAEEYVRLCRPFEAEGPAGRDGQQSGRRGKGGKAHEALIDFVKEARDRMPEVVVTAVEMPGVDTKAVKRLARDLKVKYRGRAYNCVG